MSRSLAQILLLVLVCQVSPALAQARPRFTADIAGEVRLPNNAKAPTGTMILLERQDSGVVAQAQLDSQGKFAFRGLDPMPYIVSIRLQGYEPHEQNVDLQLIPHAYLQINLKAVRKSKSIAVPPEGAGKRGPLRQQLHKPGVMCEPLALPRRVRPPAFRAGVRGWLGGWVAGDAGLCRPAS